MTSQGGGAALHDGTGGFALVRGHAVRAVVLWVALAEDVVEGKEPHRSLLTMRGQHT